MNLVSSSNSKLTISLSDYLKVSGRTGPVIYVFYTCTAHYDFKNYNHTLSHKRSSCCS